MIDIRLIRENPARVKTEIAKLNTIAPIDEIADLDQRRRQLLTEVEALKAERNDGSKVVSRTKDADERQSLIENLRVLGDSITALNEQAKQIDSELYQLMLQVPNLPLPEVPEGPDESHNVVARDVGIRNEFSFQPKPHWEI